ncbi:DNA-directed RNA polymerases I and III subunit RPAC2-like [Anneissia japonica]|uniref:DNA-directed RNA polymerases I and III subunit RPAC2-like n=1 Tax=Anneissia japonica TaxID=1529436 RepID=UPI001425B19D|nr:DNA-directed RNA polymerases I and III subunit RPAC2-like [Anneissia japonica]
MATTSNENSDAKKRRLEVVQAKDVEDETCATYVMHGEDHTLGNSLRYMIMKNPEVDFCGYCIPHPTENKINLRIQTKGASTSDVLRKGLHDLTSLCGHVLSTYEASVENFKRNQGEEMETS